MAHLAVNRPPNQRSSSSSTATSLSDGNATV
jgi:hypothetical protein